MFSATTYVIREARVHDVPELVRLGWATEETWPLGQILVGELGGVVVAALAIDENRAVIAAMRGAPQVLAQIRARAAGIQAYGRTPSVADRIRERLGRCVSVDPRTREWCAPATATDRSSSTYAGARRRAAP